MITMMGRITDLVISHTIMKLPTKDVLELKTAWIKFTSIILSLIAEAYHIYYMTAVSNVTGMNQNLLANTVKVEIDNLIDQNKGARL